MHLPFRPLRAAPFAARHGRGPDSAESSKDPPTTTRRPRDPSSRGGPRTDLVVMATPSAPCPCRGNERRGHDKRPPRALPVNCGSGRGFALVWGSATLVILAWL